MDPVVHFELPADDRERANQFYTSVFGWEIDPIPVNGDTYLTATTSPIDDEHMHEAAGAIIERAGEIVAPIITIEVDSIDERIPRIEDAGGDSVAPKDKVPGLGFYAYVRDPEGNVIGLWESLE